MKGLWIFRITGITKCTEMGDFAMNRIGGIIVIVLALICVPAQAATFLSYEASPTAWVGNGGEPHYTTEADGTVFDSRTEYWNGLRIWMTNDISFDFWDITLWPVTGQSLAVGEYPNFTESPDGTHYAMSFSSTGRGATAPAGWFEILELELGVGGAPTKLAVDFIQYEEGTTTKWVKGSVRYNSDIPAHYGPAAIPASSNKGLAILTCLLALVGFLATKCRLGTVR